MPFFTPLLSKILAKLKHLISSHPFLLVVLLVDLLLIAANYQPGTFLSGWDALHPEFNPIEYLNRILQGAYQPHQGLGAVASQAHAAEIPRMFIYLPLTVLLPLSLVRYSYFFLTIILASVGMYFFLNRILPQQHHPRIIQLAAASGALFYLLNLGTLQHYYNPLEMFPTQIAALPWLFLFAHDYLITPTKRSLFLFSITTFFASPMAHTATLWYTYFLGLCLYVFSSLLLRQTKIKQVVVILGITLMINIYWLAPNLYFVKNHGAEIPQSKIHSLFSEEAFAKNVEFSTIPDLLLLKSFPFDWGVYTENSFSPLLSTWINYQKYFPVMMIGYLFASVGIWGVLYSIREKEKQILTLFPIAAVALFFLFTTKSPVGFLFTYLQTHYPLFQEGFRFPFTKFSILLIFCYTVFFSFGIFSILSQQKITRFFRTRYPLAITIIVCLFMGYMLPAFQGFYISPTMKVNIPNAYFSLFKYLQAQPHDKRVMVLPVHSFWGWTYYSWGYQGAGFTWFGIPQPLLDREFDRWSPYNEQYYREISQAIYAKDLKQLEEIIDKFDIGYIYVDTSIIAPGSDGKVLAIKDIEQILSTLVNKQVLTSPQHFGNNLTVYPVTESKPLSYILPSAVSLSQSSPVFLKDSLYSFLSNYISPSIRLKSAPSSPSLSYPFQNLFTNQLRLQTPQLIDTPETIEIANASATQLFTSTRDAILPSLIPADIIGLRSLNSIALSFYLSLPIFNNQPSSVPTTLSFPISSKISDLFLSVNDDVFPLSSIGLQTPLSIGKTYLSSAKNTVSLFMTNKDSISPLILSRANPTFSYCEQQDNSANMHALIKKNEINIIENKNYSRCIYLPMQSLTSLVKETRSLIAISFNYKSSSTVRVCLQKSAFQSCSHFLKVTGEGVTKKVIFPIDAAQIPTSQLIIQLDPQEQAHEEKIEDIQTQTFSLLDEKVISADDFNRSILPYPTTFSSLSLPKNILSSSYPDVLQIQRFKNDCQDKQIASHKTVVQEGGQPILLYASEQGSYCDHFSYENLPHSLGYLVSIESKNVTGLPLNLCITNYSSRRCDLYTKLSRFSTVQTDTFYLPATDTEAGYDINIENVGIKGTPAKNMLKSITFTPFPYELLSSIYSVSGTDTNQQSSTNLKNLTAAGPIVVLSRSYEAGFLAYRISCTNAFSCSLKKFFAPVISKPLSDHVLVNNWANGWKLTPPLGATEQIIFVFWPQYLEYLGFLLLPFPFLFLLRRKK